MSNEALDADVIVVGGGPVGVTAALLLAGRGLSVELFEQATDIYDLPRAVGMDDEIQRVLQSVGLTDRLAGETTPILGAEFVDVDGNRIIGRDIPVGGPYHQGHHPTVMYHQPDLEAMLRSEAEAAGAVLHLGRTVNGIEDLGGHVVVDVDGKARTARWVVAADGAASPIRKTLGVAFLDLGFDQDWLVFDVELTRDVETLPTVARQICDPDRPATFVPGHNRRRRWEFQLQPEDDRTTVTAPEVVWEMISPWLSPEDAVLHRAVVYRFHATVAERMRVGSVFLAGDAAHQMPPFLGQGLCSGIRDAANLAWKLDLVHRGLAGDRLLDSYDSERRPHAVDMVAHAVDVGRLIDQLAGRVDSGVGLESGYGGGRPFPFLEDGLIDGDHNKVGKPLAQPTVDGRLFDESLGSGFSILTARRERVPTEVAAAWAEVGGVVVEAPEETVTEGPFAFLADSTAAIVRPDRYVAAVATDEAELAAASERLLAGLGRGAEGVAP